MGTFSVMLRNVILFVALALPGLLLVKAGILEQKQTGVLSKLLMYIGLPLMIFSGTMQNVSFDMAFLKSAIAVALVDIAFHLIFIFVLSKPMTAMERDERKQRTMRFCADFPNNGFLGIPLAAAVFGSDSPVFNIAVIHNIVTNILLYTLGIYLMSGDKKDISLKKAFLNPVMIAAVAGCLFSRLGINRVIPEIATFSNYFSNIVAPLSMTILGMNMGGIKLQSLFTSRKVYYVSLLKLIVIPLAVMAALVFFKVILHSPVMDNDFLLATFVAISMPTAGLAPTFADTFSGDTPLAVSCTLGTTILSVVTIPALYGILCLFLGV